MTENTAESQETSATRFNPFENPQFLQLMVYRIFTMLSYQMVAVAVGWQIYSITRNPTALGTIGLAEVIPYFLVAPFAGYLVDHLKRRVLGMFSCLVLALTPLLLLLVTTDTIHVEGTWFIYLAIALSGCVRSFLGPIYNALFAQVLKRSDFVRGAGFGAVIFQMGLVLGPAFAGLAIAKWGLSTTYSLAAVFGLIAAVAVRTIKVGERPKPESRPPIFASIAEGGRFVLGNQILLAAMALDMFAVLFGGAISMLPAFIKDVLNEGPEALGILRAAPALGSVVMALWLARNPLERNAGRILLWAVALFGLCWSAFAMSQWLWLSAAILVVSGLLDGISVVLRSTIMQLTTPDDMRGRVSSINGIFIGSSNELGAFYTGSMAGLMGLIPAVFVGGLLTVAVVILTAWRAPKLRTLDLRSLE